MNTIDIKKLSARKTSVFGTEHLCLSYRIKTVTYFTSVDEVILWLSKIYLTPDKPLDLDAWDPSLGTLAPTDEILKINITDEAICSLCYELFYQYDRKDPNFISNIVEKLTQFNYQLREKEDSNLKDLIYLLDQIIFIYNTNISQPEFRSYKEERLSTMLARNYYLLLYNLYDKVFIQDDYTTKMKGFYANLFNNKNIYADQAIDIHPSFNINKGEFKI